MRKANAACGEGESDYGLIVSISVPAAIMIETIDQKSILTGKSTVSARNRRLEA
jgi:hypothetical protein